MILHTVLPLEDVLQGEVPTYRETISGGRHLLVEELPDGTRRVARLLSTDPADYLRSEWQPGARLPYV